jgi:protoporphyrinogen oxidase
MGIISLFIEKKRNMLLYGIIGVSAVIVDMLFFAVFYNLLHISPVVSTLLSVSVATMYSFILNAVYNFKTKNLIRKRLFSFVLVSLGGMILSALAIEFFSYLSIEPNIGKAISLPPIVILQYLFNKHFTFDTPQTMKNTTGDVQTVTVSDTQRVQKHVAIIGGGFTGLTAAYTLAKMGHQVTVFEAEKELGGLVSGFDLDGVPLEKAYHFLYKTDSHIINLANEIGIGDTLTFHSSSVAIAYGGKIYPFMTPLDLLKFTPLSFFNRIRAGLVTIYLSKQTHWKKFASVSALDWMLRYAGAQVTKIIWEPVLRGKFFNYFNTISMSYVWSRIYVRMNSKDKGEVTEKLGYFDGGFRTFTKRLTERCEEMGVVFRCSTKPESILQGANSAKVVVEGKAEVFDACLVTTPSHVFKHLIDTPHNMVSREYIEKLMSVDYLGAVLMVFSTDTKFTDFYWHNVNDLEQPFLVLLSLSALIGPEKLNGKHVYYVGAYVPHDHAYYRMSDDEIKTLWVQGIKNIFPHFDPHTITNSQIFKFKNAQHIVEPGYQEKIVPYQSELPNIYLSNFTQIFPDDRGTNYAVAEGIKVANLIDTNLHA